ncbi:ABC transporter substrate-binding protein [Promicromonospora thailandica]|uniref:Carbohydrate ABC transporter substrate-binding protein, CUT1 family (TC 3.A.1.1.-) n=1 Tax=Promicromonospora thailandica TaxID=765201 RepID=A0A9X2FZH5_9MICO|nr:sugar ABC transporter substrate-binding protein [Promicromonospora thailandica]MCP2264029.1 carbohydrate ABC transporter substrate-binding protein, CUT1 family (TC 3.A.1.1.-) [Promicromonospora thailandica]BFF17633.1 extracellular solute-binding protein [Promicromonospora thailandica]
MNSRRFGAAGLALAVLTVLPLGGCALDGTGGGEQTEAADASGEVTGEVTLQTWALKPSFTGYVEGVIDAFEKQYPGTTVTWLDQPGDGYSEKVLAQAAAGELPDVTNLPPDFALSLAREGLLTDLSTVDDTLADTYVAGALDAYRYGGIEGTYGYPWYLTTDLNYWNTEMLEEAGLDPARLPTTLDELVAQAQTMKDATGEYLMSRKPGLGDFAAAGLPVLSDDGTQFTFDTPEAAAILDVYRDAYADGLLPDDVLTDAYLGNSQLFTEGKVAWTTGGGNFIDSVLENNPSLEGKITSSPYIGATPLYVQGVSVSHGSDNPATALALAQFLTNAANQEEFAEQVPGIFPSTTSSQENPELAESDGTPQGAAKQIAFGNLTTARVLQPVEVTEAMVTIVNQQFAAAIAGDKTSAEALEAAVDECNKLLADQ